MWIKTLASNSAILATSSLIAVSLLEVAVRTLDLASPARAATRVHADDADPADPTLGGTANRLLAHPFRGWSRRPAADFELELERSRFPFNLFGFRSSFWDYRTLENDDFVVGVFGGSVAERVANSGASTIEEIIAQRRPELAGRIRVLSFAVPAYKQPQQLFLLQEMLLLDVPLDLVVNLDGFNEVALSADQATRGVHPLLPYSNQWMLALRLASRTPSPAQIELSAEIVRSRGRAMRLRAFLRDHALLSRSEALRAAIGLWIVTSEDRAVTVEQSLAELAAGEGSGRTSVHIPDRCLGDRLECFELIAENWRKASELMATIAAREDILYVHFLQPNQYVEGSKQLTAEELARAYRPERPWSRGAMAGYPLLQRQGENLLRQGILFHDMTQVFADARQSLYVDDCCHFNRAATEILGAEMAEKIVDALHRR